MDGDFYRRPPKKNLLRSIVKRLFKTRRSGIITIAAAVLVFYVLFDNKGIITRVRLEMQRKEMAVKVKTDEETTNQLRSDLKALQGEKKTIEKVAREKHGMVREGETVYRVKKD